MKTISILIFVMSICFLSSCAIGYSNIKTANLNFNEVTQQDSVVIKVIQHPLLDAKNERYNKIFKKNHLRMLALEITNNSSNDFLVDNNNLKIVDQVNTKYPIPFDSVNVFIPDLMQNPCKYMLWLPFNIYAVLFEVSFGNLFDNDSDTRFKIIPIGLIIGPLNAGRAGYNNYKLKKNLKELDLYGQIIPAGKSRKGIICVPYYKETPLIINTIKQ